MQSMIMPDSIDDHECNNDNNWYLTGFTIDVNNYQVINERNDMLS